MKDSTPTTIVGIDLGDRLSRVHVLSAATGEVVDTYPLPTSKEAFSSQFAGKPRARIALETGTHALWVGRLLAELGHEVMVGHARSLRLITHNARKNDKLDAERLALLARADPKLLHPIRLRSEAAQHGLIVLKARDGLVRARTSLINLVRGHVKSIGERLPKCPAETFHKHAHGHLPQTVRLALQPILDQIASLTAAIRGYDRQVEKMAKEQFPDCELLQQVEGVGALTALAYALTVEDVRRFRSGGAVASYLGLVPRQRESGDRDPQLRITKAGNGFTRRLLVCSAQYVLGPFAKDSDLRRWGQRLCERGGKNAKRRAVVAVARKIAVLLRHLWRTGEVYEPLRNAHRNAAKRECAAGA